MGGPAIVLQHPDRARHAFQYVDWQFDGADLIVASRTAFDDGLGGATAPTTPTSSRFIALRSSETYEPSRKVHWPGHLS